MILILVILGYLVMGYFTSLLTAYVIGQGFVRQSRLDGDDMVLIGFASIFWPLGLPSCLGAVIFKKIGRIFKKIGRKIREKKLPDPWDIFFKLGQKSAES